MHTREQYISVISSRYTEVFSYVGMLEHATITRVLKDIKTIIQADYNTKKRIYGIVNELLENTMIHQKSRGDKVEVSILKSDSSYRIITFNTSGQNEMQSLLKNSSNINLMTREQLRRRYREKLLTGLINEKGTIGVGMELVRIKSRNKILISTEESDDQSIVIIDVKVDN